MATKTKCSLIIDARERNIIRHSKEFESISYEVKQITTGDYVIITPKEKILAVIERKSLDDFSASLKDGRHANRQKLIALREQTGCAVVYLVEGPESPPPTQCFAGIPYKHIESSIFHLMVRDNITVLRTRDTLDTAKTLSRFVLSMDTLSDQKRPRHDVPPIDTPITELLTQKHTKTDHEVVRELWSRFRGITTETADEYIKVWSICDILRGRIPHDEIANFKMAIGRKINKRVVKVLSDKHVDQTKLLSTVPGISQKGAEMILKVGTLQQLLTWEVGGLAMIQTTAAGAKMGNVIAERVLRLFNYKGAHNDKCAGNKPPVNDATLMRDPVSLITVDDPDILNLLDTLN